MFAALLHQLLVLVFLSCSSLSQILFFPLLHQLSTASSSCLSLFSLSFFCCHFCTVVSVFFLSFALWKFVVATVVSFFLLLQLLLSVSLGNFVVATIASFVLFYFFPVFLWLFCYKQPAALFV